MPCISLADGVIGREGDVLQVRLEGTEPINHVAPVADYCVQNGGPPHALSEIPGFEQAARPHTRDVDINGQFLDPKP